MASPAKRKFERDDSSLDKMLARLGLVKGENQQLKAILEECNERLQLVESENQQLKVILEDIEGENQQLKAVLEDVEGENQRLKAELEECNLRVDEYISPIQPKKLIEDYDMEAPLQKLDEVMRLFGKILEDEKVYEDKVKNELILAFQRLTPRNRSILLYLCKARAATLHLMDPSHKLSLLSNVEWISLLIRISGRINSTFGVNGICLGDGGDRKFMVNIYLKDGTRFAIYMSRLLCGIMFGILTLMGRDASHLCGNGLCLHFNHIVLESHAKNTSRDQHHKLGLFGEDCDHGEFLCLPSLKHENSTNLDVSSGELKHEIEDRKDGVFKFARDGPKGNIRHEGRTFFWTSIKTYACQEYVPAKEGV